jgi:hypothetical protein
MARSFDKAEIYRLLSLPINHPKALAFTENPPQVVKLIVGLASKQIWAWTFVTIQPQSGTFLHWLRMMCTQKAIVYHQGRVEKIRDMIKVHARKIEATIMREWSQEWDENIIEERYRPKYGSEVVGHDGTVNTHTLWFNLLLEPAEINLETHEEDAKNSKLHFFGGDLDMPPGFKERRERIDMEIHEKNMLAIDEHCNQYTGLPTHMDESFTAPMEVDARHMGFPAQHGQHLEDAQNRATESQQQHLGMQNLFQNPQFSLLSYNPRIHHVASDSHIQRAPTGRLSQRQQQRPLGTGLGRTEQPLFDMRHNHQNQQTGQYRREQNNHNGSRQPFIGMQQSQQIPQVEQYGQRILSQNGNQQDFSGMQQYRQNPQLEQYRQKQRPQQLQRYHSRGQLLQPQPYTIPEPAKPQYLESQQYPIYNDPLLTNNPFPSKYRPGFNAFNDQNQRIQDTHATFPNYLAPHVQQVQQPPVQQKYTGPLPKAQRQPLGELQSQTRQVNSQPQNDLFSQDGMFNDFYN